MLFTAKRCNTFIHHGGYSDTSDKVPTNRMNINSVKLKYLITRRTYFPPPTQVLAFYSRMGSENVRTFNTHDADLQLRDILADIKLMLTGAVIHSPGLGSGESPPLTASDTRMV